MLLADVGETAMAQLMLSALLLAIAGGLTWHHKIAWNVAQVDPENLRAIEFARVQYRRRMLASGLLAIISVVILIAVFVPSAFMAAWFVVLVLLLWILVLALIDAAHSYKFLRQQRRRHLVEQAELQAALLREIRRLRENQND